MKMTKCFLLAFICLITTPAFAMDQCNTTAQCKQQFGSKATDCKDSRSNRSVCYCGKNACGAKSNSSSLVFNMNFNKVKIGDPLPRGSRDARTFSKIGGNCGPDRSRCLVTKYKPADNGSARQGARYPIKPAKEYTLQYDLYLDKNFEFVKGGKLHGLAPENGTTGCRPQVANGWSARVMWNGAGGALLYIYDQDRVSKKKACGHGYHTKNNVLKRGKWQAISLYVKLNTVGKRDGVAELWIDGKREARKTGIKFRGTGKDTLISNMNFSTFYGGNNPSWKPSKTTSMRTDNYRVVKGRAVRKKPFK